MVCNENTLLPSFSCMDHALFMEHATRGMLNPLNTPIKNLEFIRADNKDHRMKQHSPRFLTYVTQVRKQVKEITPQTLKALIDSQQPFHLIDVREADELPSGRIATAIHLSKGIIERDIEKQIPDPQAPIVVYCSGGFRCALVANSLQNMGYTNVSSLDTGLQGWIDSGYPIEK